VAFDHDYWRHQTPTTWRERDLHWHCFSWQGTPPKDGDRRNPQLAVPPIEIKHWLLKPPTMLARAVHTPEEAADWLKDQPQPPEPGAAVERALHELRVGNNVIWGFWLPSQAFTSIAVVGVPADQTPPAQCRHHP